MVGGLGRLTLAALVVVGACSAPDPGEGPLVVDFGDELGDTHREVLFNAVELELVAVDPKPLMCHERPFRSLPHMEPCARTYVKWTRARGVAVLLDERSRYDTRTA